MKMTVNYSLVLFASVLGCFSVACSSDGGSSKNNNGGTGAGGGGSGDNVVLTPSDTGWVDKGSNPLMIQGAWYAYGDGVGPDGMPPGDCQTKGMHTTDECSKITTPSPGAFAPDPAKGMCTTGTVAKILNLSGSPDYDNMWGAGIGLDFGAPSEGETTAKHVVDLSAYKGISFTIGDKPLPGLRVEFPMPATEPGNPQGNKGGSDYWGADSSYSPSPVKGNMVNTIMWADIKAPGSSTVAFDPKQMLGIQFHVPTATSAAGAYDFCIKDVTIIK
jgi:hypothetical protein